MATPWKQSLRIVRETMTEAEHYGKQILVEKDAAAIAAALIGDEAQEVSLAIFLDQKHNVRGYQEIGRGEIGSCPMPPDVVLRAALLSGCPALIVAHNHPSGDPTPSGDDYAVTSRLQRAAEIVGIEFLDHIVVGEFGSFRSAKR